MYKKNQRETNVVDGIDTALSVTSVGLPASGVGLLSSIIAAPVALGLQAGAIECELLGPAGNWLQAKTGKHDLIRDLAESKPNTITDRISVALKTDKITEEEFRLIISEVDKYNHMKAEIREHQKQSGGLSEDEKQAISACERRSHDYCRANIY